MLSECLLLKINFNSKLKTMKQITTIAYFIVLVIACTSPSKKQVSAIEQREKDIQKQEEKNDNKPIYYETEIIDLSQRGISSLPDSILKFHNLKSINLSDNNFKSFPIELFELPLLEEINFQKDFYPLTKCLIL